MGKSESETAYGLLKTVGGKFTLHRVGSGFELKLYKDTQAPNVEAKAKQTKGDFIAGTFKADAGEHKFEITHTKGKIPLNQNVKIAVRDGIGVSKMPIVEAASTVEETPTEVEEGIQSPPPAPNVAGVDASAFDDMQMMDDLFGELDNAEAEDDPIVKSGEVEAHDMASLSDLDFLAQIDLDSNVGFSGSVKDIAMARLAWSQAEKSAEKLLKSLADSILSDFPTETSTAAGVTEAIRQVQGGALFDTLDDLSNAKGKQREGHDVATKSKIDAEINKAHAKTLEELTTYENFVATDPLLAHIDSSPYQVGSVRDQLNTAIKAIRKNLT